MPDETKGRHPHSEVRDTWPCDPPPTPCITDTSTKLKFQYTLYVSTNVFHIVGVITLKYIFYFQPNVSWPTTEFKIQFFLNI